MIRLLGGSRSPDPDRTRSSLACNRNPLLPSPSFPRCNSGSCPQATRPPGWPHVFALRLCVTITGHSKVGAWILRKALMYDNGCGTRTPAAVAAPRGEKASEKAHFPAVVDDFFSCL